MKRELKPHIKGIMDNISYSDILNDTFVINEFHKRNLRLQDVGEVVLVFRESGKVHVHGSFSTESHSCEIAIMKLLIKEDIVSNDENYDNAMPLV